MSENLISSLAQGNGLQAWDMQTFGPVFHSFFRVRDCNCDWDTARVLPPSARVRNLLVHYQAPASAAILAEVVQSLSNLCTPR